jgi:hypothetical protein
VIKLSAEARRLSVGRAKAEELEAKKPGAEGKLSLFMFWLPLMR